MAKRVKYTTETFWIGLPDNFKIEDYYGFIYSITNDETGIKYIGRKYFWSNRKKKVKGKKRKVKVKSESDWKFYKSSSKVVQKAIQVEGEDAFTFEILSLHKTRSEVNYSETKELFTRDVLYKKLRNGKYAYMNENIMSRYFRKKDA